MPETAQMTWDKLHAARTIFILWVWLPNTNYDEAFHSPPLNS